MSSGTEIDREAVIDIIDEVEDEVLDEDKMGATRDMIAEGTCARIRERVRYHREKEAQ